MTSGYKNRDLQRFGLWQRLNSFDHIFLCLDWSGGDFTQIILIYKYIFLGIIDTYCWIHSTFSIPERFVGKQGRWILLLNFLFKKLKFFCKSQST